MQLDREPTAEVATAPPVEYDDFVAHLRPGEAIEILAQWERLDGGLTSLPSVCFQSGKTSLESLPPFLLS